MRRGPIRHVAWTPPYEDLYLGNRQHRLRYFDCPLLNVGVLVASIPRKYDFEGHEKVVEGDIWTPPALWWAFERKSVPLGYSGRGNALCKLLHDLATRSTYRWVLLRTMFMTIRSI